MIHLVSHVDYTDPSLVVAECGAVAHANEGVIVDSSRFKMLDTEDQCPECKEVM